MKPSTGTVRGFWLGLLVLALLAYSTMFRAVTAPNERSRVYLAVALVDHHTLAIDAPVERFGEILDAASFDHHVYSDKAPGSSVLGAVVYGAARLFTPASAWSIDDLLTLMRRWVMIPIGLGGFWLLGALLRRAGVRSALADLVSVAWILGTSAFHYSTAFYGHQIVAVLLLAALYWVIVAEDAATTRPGWATFVALAAGAAAGFAGFTEYQAGIPAALLALYVVSGPLARRVWPLLAFALAAGLFVLALGAYHRAAFGGAFELSYHHLENRGLQSIHNQGVGGITRPNWASFEGGILSLHRGLIATSPMFLAAFPGAAVLWRSGRRRLALLTAVTSAYFIAFISSSNMWVAGWGFGPRLLVPGMPWALVLVAHGLAAVSRSAWGEGLARGALVVGVAYQQLVHAFFPEPPDTASNPLLDVIAPLARAHLVAPNVMQRWFGVTGLASLWPLLALVLVALTWLATSSLRARGVMERVVSWLTTPLPLLAILGAALLLGPSGTEYTRKAFVDLVTGLAAGE